MGSTSLQFSLFETTSATSIFLVTSVVWCTICCILLFFLLSARHLSRILVDAAEGAETGVVIFNKKGQLEFANTRAKTYISVLSKKNKSKPKLLDFLDFLYDHAVSFDETVQNAIVQSTTDLLPLSFREFIRLENNNIFLANMRNLEGNRTLFLLNDISRNKNREERILRLYEFNHQLIEAIEASTCGIVVSDLKHERNPIIFVNEAFCNILKRNRAEIIGSSLDIIIPILANINEPKKFEAAIKDSQHIKLEISLKQEEQTRWFNLEFSPVENDMGDLDLYIGVFTENTLLKQSEAALFQSQKLEALAKLAAGVAHDFNNILSIIDGYTLMANNLSATDYAKAQEYLQKISITSRRGAGLTQKMLTFSRHKVISQNVVDLREILEEQKILLMPLLGASIHFDLRFEGGGMYIKAAPDALTQILMNLCINARDAMPEGGNLFIDISRQLYTNTPQNIQEELGKNITRDVVKILVRDTGTGMDEKTRDRMFDPFFTTKPQGKGTGLGLSIVYGLIKETGGAIDVKSRLGQGTEFSLYFPLSAEQPKNKTKIKSEETNGPILKGYTVLLTEDEPDLLIVVSKMLQDLGLKVLEAKNGLEALKLQESYEGTIDILLTDVVMPEMSGVKLAELMISLRPDTKAIYMSGYPENGDMAPVILPENASFVAKPLDYKMLAEFLINVVNQNHPQTTDMPHWQATKGKQSKA